MDHRTSPLNYHEIFFFLKMWIKKKGCVRDESDAVWERGMRDVWDQGHNDGIAKKIVFVVTLWSPKVGHPK